MKIVLVTNNYKPYSGGVVSAIDVLAQSLVRLGHQVYLVTLDFEGLGNNLVDGVKIIRLFSPIRFKYKTNHIAIPWCPKQAVLNIITQIKPDIIHSHHPFLLGVAALRAANKLNIPLVFTYHSQYEKFSHLVPLPQILCANLIFKKVLNYCRQVSGLILPSATIAQLLKPALLNVPIRVIPSAIAALYLSNDFNYKAPHKTFQLLTVSRFAKEKNIVFLLDMFKQLLERQANLGQNYCLTLVGYGPELVHLKQYAYIDLGLSPQIVIFVERPSKESIKQYYERADLFIFASQAETQGLVLAEAMACGTPVVALAGAGANDLIVDGKNGFIIHNILDMIIAIELINNNVSLHEFMQKNAWETARQYDANFLVQILLKFYNELIKNKKLDIEKNDKNKKNISYNRFV